MYELYGYGEELPPKDWTRIVDRWLRGYDPVTKYIYDRELERKRLRLNEGILTTKETQNALNDALKLAANLLLTQSLQYGLDLVAQMELEAYDALDVDEVMYHACDDEKTCKECWKDNGKIFRLEEAPRVPRHNRCRCWYTAVL